MKSLLNLLLKNLLIAFILLMFAAKAGAKAIPSHPGFDCSKAVNETVIQNKRYAGALSKGDSIALLNLYTKDAILLNDGRPSAIGHAAIRHFYSRMIRHGVTTFSFITTNLWGSENNLIGEDGTLTFALASGRLWPKEGTCLSGEVKNGELKIFRDTYFSDNN